jgi:GAF domain-containing protein
MELQHASGARDRGAMSAETDEPQGGMAQTYPVRERAVAQAFVRAAGAQAHDTAEMLDDVVTDCVRLFGLAAAGLMLTDKSGRLRVAASSSEALHTLEMFELQAGEGPCLDCYRSGRLVAVEDAQELARRWPRVAARSRRLGLGATYAVPLKHDHTAIGALNLFTRHHVGLSRDDLAVAEALAAVVAVSVLRSRSVEAAQDLADQLQAALNSRIAIEQAKGVIAATLDVDTQRAFDLLRAHARRNSMPLSRLAADVSARRLDPSTLMSRPETRLE